MLEQASAAGTVGVAEHQRLEQSFAALNDQFEAANEVLVALGRSAGDPDAVLTTIVESARRICQSQAAHLYLLEDGVYRLIKAVGVSEEVHRVHRRAPDADGPRHAHRASGPRPHDTADSRRPRGPGLRPQRSSAGGPLPHDHGRAPGDRRRGRGQHVRLAQRGQPVRRARDGHRDRVRGSGGDGDQRGEARAGARGAPSGARAQGRRARGAARGGRGRGIQPRRRARALDDRHARRRAVRNGWRLDPGVRRARPLLHGSSHVPDGARRSSTGYAASGSSSTRHWSAGRPRNADRWLSPTWTRSTWTRICASCSESGWRSVLAVPMLREGQIVGALIVRRKRTGSFSAETVRADGDLREPVDAGAAQRPVVP